MRQSRTSAEITEDMNRLEIPVKTIGVQTFGQLGEFIFTRKNYYMVVDGKVPLAVANELYTGPYVGKSDIRSGGDCGCREPKTWATYYNGDKVVISYEESLKIKEWATPNKDGQLSEIAQGILKNPKYYLPTSEEERCGYPAFVETYHIDSELGVYIFIQTLKKHNLI